MHWLESWVLPPRCVLSDEQGLDLDLSPLHINALKQPHQVCPQCCEPSADKKLCGACLTMPPFYDRTRVGYYFDSPLDELIHQFKYANQVSHARLLAELCVEHFKNSDVGALVAVPIHPKRRRERGYNQAQLLAKELGRLLAIPVLPKAISRVKATPSQTGLSKKQRQANLNQAFAVNAPQLQGLQKIALVDDVITTGATMQALAKQIKAHTQIAWIEAWAVAKTK